MSEDMGLIPDNTEDPTGKGYIDRGFLSDITNSASYYGNVRYSRFHNKYTIVFELIKERELMYFTDDEVLRLREALNKLVGAYEKFSKNE